MPGVALLVFREVLEAALIVSIVCAATRGVPRRGLFVVGGIGLGVVGALLVAFGAGFIANLAGGAGQDVFNASVLLSAVVMIGWHVVWMSAHGREMAKHMQAVGGAVKAGSRSLAVLLTVVALAVLREGSEVVLFLYGIALGGNGGPLAMTLGGVIGLALGVAAGAGIYWGLVSIPMRQLFRVTSWLVLLLAAGLASQGAAFLMQADLLPPLGSNIWNTSFLLSDQSLAGKMLHTLIGYTAQPAGIQVVFYVVTLTVIVVLMRLLAPENAKRSGARGSASAVPGE